MNEASLISSGLRMVNRNKRYIFWFWLLNLTLAEFATGPGRARLHDALDHSLLADRLLHGFDLSVYLDMVTRPEWGSFGVSAWTATYFALVFFLASLVFMPGVLEGYTTDGRLRREDFFRACGRNLWRFVRLFLLFGIIAGPTAGILFGFHHVLVKAAEKSTNEKLGFYTIVATLTVIFLVMTAIRAWFDLAQVDVVVRDQNAVRKSIASAWRQAWANCFRLVASYVVVAVIGVLILVAGVLAWSTVPPSSVAGAFPGEPTHGDRSTLDALLAKRLRGCASPTPGRGRRAGFNSPPSAHSRAVWHGRTVYPAADPTGHASHPGRGTLGLSLYEFFHRLSKSRARQGFSHSTLVAVE